LAAIAALFLTAAAARAAAAPDACAAAAPVPLLKKSAYRNYSYAAGKENDAVEKATTGTEAAGIVEIEISTAGCYDGVERSFTFRLRRAKETYDDALRWLDFAARELADLKFASARGRADAENLAAFLRKVRSGAQKPPARTNGSELRIESCFDGSSPGEDGCSQASGGGYRFAARKLGAGGVEVYASRYSAL
jgi:hypothetical protein